MVLQLKAGECFSLLSLPELIARFSPRQPVFNSGKAKEDREESSKAENQKAAISANLFQSERKINQREIR